MDILFLIGRVVFGVYFLMNGINHLFSKTGMLTGYAQSKGVPSPKLAVYLSGLLIFLGGLGMLLGIYVELSLWLIAVFLLFVTFKMHQFWKVDEPMARMSEMVNFTKNMALLGATLMLLYLASSAWPYALVL